MLFTGPPNNEEISGQFHHPSRQHLLSARSNPTTQTSMALQANSAEPKMIMKSCYVARRLLGFEYRRTGQYLLWASPWLRSLDSADLISLWTQRLAVRCPQLGGL